MIFKDHVQNLRERQLVEDKGASYCPGSTRPSSSRSSAAVTSYQDRTGQLGFSRPSMRTGKTSSTSWVQDELVGGVWPS